MGASKSTVKRKKSLQFVGEIWLGEELKEVFLSKKTIKLWEAY